MFFDTRMEDGSFVAFMKVEATTVLPREPLKVGLSRNSYRKRQDRTRL